MEKTPREKIERVPTGIPGFDDLVCGGFERNSVNILKGGPGTGKTTFALQYLFNGCVKYKEPSLFVSFEESKDSVYSTAELFGWDLEKLEKSGYFTFLAYRPLEIMKMLTEGGGMLESSIEEIGARRVVIDSLTSFSILFKSSYERDEQHLNLIQSLKSWNCTALVTEEKGVEVAMLEESRASFLCDSLIHMYYIRKEAMKYRAIEVVKMRRTKHSEKISVLKIEEDGVAIHPEVSLFG